jgi:hypothetical protein
LRYLKKYIRRFFSKAGLPVKIGLYSETNKFKNLFPVFFIKNQKIFGFCLDLGLVFFGFLGLGYGYGPKTKEIVMPIFA